MKRSGSGACDLSGPYVPRLSSARARTKAKGHHTQRKRLLARAKQPARRTRLRTLMLACGC